MSSTTPAPVAAAATSATSAARATALLPNPTLHLDAQLHILVMEFHDRAGNVMSTVPTARQLQAYRLSALTSPAVPDAASAVAAAKSSLSPSEARDNPVAASGVAAYPRSPSPSANH